MRAQTNETVVLTGCGWVTPFAAGTIVDVASAARNLVAPPPISEGFWSVPSELCVDSKAASGEIQRDRGAWITATALEHALRSASISLEEVEAPRVCLVLGNALAGQSGMIRFAEEVRQQSPRFVSPIHFPQTVGNYVAGAIARAYGITGPNSTVATGAASGLDAIVEARGILAFGAADVVIAGGMETLSAELALGLEEAGVRLSEGACLFVLERANQAKHRGAPILATLGPIRHRGLPPGSDAPENYVIRSTILQRVPDAICIEHWIGRCFGSLGAAAVAGAIAAGAGNSVPFFDADRGEVIDVRCRTQAPASASLGPLRAVVTADADGTGSRVIHVDLALEPGN